MLCFSCSVSVLKISSFDKYHTNVATVNDFLNVALSGRLNQTNPVLTTVEMENAGVARPLFSCRPCDLGRLDTLHVHINFQKTVS